MDTLIVNLFAGPGVGKSTIASGIFSELKWAGVDCEYVHEFAKWLVWQDHQSPLACQPFIYGTQLWMNECLQGKVEVLVTDSPVLLSLIYDKDNCDAWKHSVVKRFKKKNHMNFYLQRMKPYNPNGRNQNEDEARQLDFDIHNMLMDYGIPFELIPGSRQGQETAIRRILEHLGKR